MKLYKTLIFATFLIVSCRPEDHPTPISLSSWNYTGIEMEVGHYQFIFSNANDRNLLLLSEDKFISINTENVKINEKIFDKRCWDSPSPYLNSDFYVTIHHREVLYPENDLNIDINSTKLDLETFSLDYWTLFDFDLTVPHDESPTVPDLAFKGNLCAINNLNQVLMVFHDWKLDANYRFFLLDITTNENKISLEHNKTFFIPEFKDASIYGVTIYNINDFFIVSSNEVEGTYKIDRFGNVDKISNRSNRYAPIVDENDIYINYRIKRVLHSDNYGETWTEKEMTLPHKVLGQIGNTFYCTNNYQIYKGFQIHKSKKGEIIKTTDFIEEKPFFVSSVDTAYSTNVLGVFNNKLYGICNNKLYSLDLDNK